MESSQPRQQIGRYTLYREIAAGGMATVHLGRLLGPVGFARTVAIKRLHPQFAKDPEFVAMFLDEARLAARIRHPNVVPTLDVVALAGELFLVMEYVQGESLARLMRGARTGGERVPPAIAATLLVGVLHGLHAAHEAKSDRGEPLGIVHRDISPQNVLCGVDGIARVVDFGVAKAAGRIQTTRDGQLKGKLAYLSPEQLKAASVDRRTDVYAAAVVLWEVLAGRRLIHGDNEGAVVRMVLEGQFDPPSIHAGDLPPALDAVTLKGLRTDPAERFATAREMAVALEECLPLAVPSKVAEWIERIAGAALQERAQHVATIESDPSIVPSAPGRALLDDTPAPARDETGITELSSGSVSAPGGPQVAARRVPRWMIATAGAAILLVPALVAIRACGRAAVQTAAMPAAPAVPDAGATLSAEPAVAFSSPPPVPVACVSATHRAPKSAGAKPTSIQSSAPGPTLPAPVPSCTVRSFLDESGIKHYVKECK